MNPTQAAARQALLGVSIPRVIQKYINLGSGSSVVVTIPQYTGKLCIVVVYTTTTSTPSLLTGFTSIANNLGAGTNPGFRAQYKFLNGSEATTLTSTTAAGGTTMAYVYLIDGAISNRVPNGTSTISTIDPPSVTATAPTGNCLFIATAGSNDSNAIVSQWPAGFSTRDAMEYSTSLFASGITTLSTNIPTNNPSTFAFTPSGSSTLIACTIAVRGA